MNLNNIILFLLQKTILGRGFAQRFLLRLLEKRLIMEYFHKERWEDPHFINYLCKRIGYKVIGQH